MRRVQEQTSLLPITREEAVKHIALGMSMINRARDPHHPYFTLTGGRGKVEHSLALWRCGLNSIQYVLAANSVQRILTTSERLILTRQLLRYPKRHVVHGRFIDAFSQ